MGLALLESSCLGAASWWSRRLTVAHEGTLQYQGRDGAWKERWFVLDGAAFGLIKCDRSRGNAPGNRMLLATVQPLSAQGEAEAAATVDAQTESSSAVPGFEVVTRDGQRRQFRTPSEADARAWVSAMLPLTQGFTPAVTQRMAERELLAGKYALVRELGRGASGVVSLYTYQGKPYAIKKFIPTKARGIPNRRASPGLVPQPAQPLVGGASYSTASGGSVTASAIPDDVRREIALLKKASRLPYVIQLHDVIVDADASQYYLVMEYMGGGAIAEWDGERRCYVRTGPKRRGMGLLDEATVRVYMTHALLGLQALHHNRLCHRDIKPENLMADETHTVCKIGDLGVAHYFREEDGELRDEVNPELIALWNVGDEKNLATDQDVTESDVSTLSSTVPQGAVGMTAGASRKGMLRSTKGTYQFLPPEALSGDAFDGFKADIWAVGVTMYALFFGFLPFFDMDMTKLFDKIERDDVVFPVGCRDEDVKQLLRGILEKDPEKRMSIEAILDHAWMHRDADSKALRQQVRALKRAPALRIDEADLGAAVSVLQNRFDALSDALQRSRLGGGSISLPADAATATTDSDKPIRLDVGREATADYTPRPIDTSTVTIPDWMVLDRDVLAGQVHFNWCRGKHVDGWAYGIHRDDAARMHPSLVPARELSESDRQKNLRCVDETLKCVLALGCRVKKSNRIRARSTSSSPLSSPKPGVGQSHPLVTDHITLTWQLLLLLDLLAENSHEVWAQGYVASGWYHGKHFDEERKTHPSLRSFMSLDEHEKNLTRDGISAILKSCVALGYEISFTREDSDTSPRSRRKSQQFAV